MTSSNPGTNLTDSLVVGFKPGDGTDSLDGFKLGDGNSLDGFKLGDGAGSLVGLELESGGDSLVGFKLETAAGSLVGLTLGGGGDSLVGFK
jgi:hypothetical protein